MNKCYTCGCPDNEYAKGFCSYHYRMDRYYNNKEAELESFRKYQRDNRKRRTAYFKQYRKTLKGKANTNKANAEYLIRNKDKKKTWLLAQKIPLKPCQVCGNPKSVRHHPDYSKPEEVVFLCHLHHKEEHRRLKSVVV